MFEYRGRLRRYRGTIPRINPLVLLDVERAQRRLNRLARTRSHRGAVGGARRRPPRRARPPRAGCAATCVTRPGRSLLELGIEAVWAAEPEDISLLHMLFYIHSAGSLELLFDTEGGAQQDRFVGGSQLLAIRMAEQLGRAGPSRPRRCAPIEHGADGVVVRADGAEVRARRAILAMAPTLAGRIAYDPPLPGYRDQLTQRMPLGTVAKCMAMYDEPFWRADGLSGEGTSDVGPVRLTFDNSPPDGSPGVLLGFLEGRHARQLGRLAPAERRTAVMDCFARLFGPRAARPERTWSASGPRRSGRAAATAVTCPPAPGPTTGPRCVSRSGPLHWAGAEIATVWNGYMDGAVRSGETAAAEVLERL